MITATSRSEDGTVEVTVTPGGGLHELALTERAPRLGPAALADAVLAAVNLATARANRRARFALRDTVAGDPDADLAAIGIVDDPALDALTEDTTPTVRAAL